MKMEVWDVILSFLCFQGLSIHVLDANRLRIYKQKDWGGLDNQKYKFSANC